MKRLLAAALVLCAAVGLASYASADVHWGFADAKFYNSQANAAGKTDVDSVFACGTTVRADTTAPYLMDSAMQGFALFSAATATRDSIPYLGLIISPSPGSSVGMDSVYVGLQVSLDGANWVTVTQTQTFLAATTYPPIASACLLELASSNTVGIVWKQNIANTANAVSWLLQDATAPSNLQLFGFRYARAILTSFDTTGCLQAKWCHWMDDDD